VEEVKHTVTVHHQGTLQYMKKNGKQNKDGFETIGFYSNERVETARLYLFAALQREDSGHWRNEEDLIFLNYWNGAEIDSTGRAHWGQVAGCDRAEFVLRHATSDVITYPIIPTRHNDTSKAALLALLGIFAAITGVGLLCAMQWRHLICQCAKPNLMCQMRSVARRATGDDA